MVLGWSSERNDHQRCVMRRRWSELFKAGPRPHQVHTAEQIHSPSFTFPNVGLNIQIHIQVDSSWLKFTKTWVHCGYIQSQPSILILVQIKSTTSFLHLPSFWWFISTDNQKWNEVLMVKIIEVDLKTILLSFFDHLPMQKLGPTMIMQPWPSELHWKLNHCQSQTWSSKR